MVNLEEKFILLEISGEHGDIETYKNILLDANALNIKRILFACIWDEQEEKGEELLKKVQEMCRTLYIEPFPSILGSKEMMFKSAMVGTASFIIEDIVIPSLSNMVSLEDYKNNKTLASHAETYMGKFMEKLENGELTRKEEPTNNPVKLDESFIEEKVADFNEMLNSPFGELIKQATNNTDKSLSLTPKDKEE